MAIIGFITVLVLGLWLIYFGSKLGKKSNWRNWRVMLIATLIHFLGCFVIWLAFHYAPFIMIIQGDL